MEAKVIKLVDYRHNSTLKIPVSDKEINEAFRWIRSSITSWPVCPETPSKITTIGITSNKKGEMLLLIFFIFLSFLSFFDHTGSECTQQRKTFLELERKFLDQWADFVDKRG